MDADRLERAAANADCDALRYLAADRSRPPRERDRARRLAVRFDRARRNFNPAAAPPIREADLRSNFAPSPPPPWCGLADRNFTRCGVETARRDCPGCHAWRCACGAWNAPEQDGCGSCRRPWTTLAEARR